MEYTDKKIQCKICKQDFIWKTGEQEFYASKGLSAPTKCKNCRSKKEIKPVEKEEVVQKKETFENKSSMTIEEIEAIIKFWDENAAALRAKRNKKKK